LHDSTEDAARHASPHHRRLPQRVPACGNHACMRIALTAGLA
jgi:hypothetical protein